MYYLYIGHIWHIASLCSFLMQILFATAALPAYHVNLLVWPLASPLTAQDLPKCTWRADSAAANWEASGVEFSASNKTLLAESPGRTLLQQVKKNICSLKVYKVGHEAKHTLKSILNFTYTLINSQCNVPTFSETPNKL